MKTKVLIKLLIAFSALSIVSISIILACAGGDEGWFGYSNFAPEPHSDKAFSPLFHSSSEMFYGIGYEGGYNERFNEEIVKDWKSYLQDKIDETNLSFLMTNEKSAQVVEDLYSFTSKGQKSGSYNEWSTKINLSNNEVKSFIEFLHFAKEIEKSSVNSFDYWDYENAKKPPFVDQNIITQIKSKYQSVSNSFLKNRYWFQTIKAYFYSETKNEASTFFEKTKNEVPKNTLYYRAISYLAGIAKKSQDYSKANYLYSIVFDKCESMRITALYSFHPQSENDWKESLALTKNTDEKIALWAMLGYYADEKRAIEEIYKLNPKCTYLDFLLTRLVNKLEYAISMLDFESIAQYKSGVQGKLQENGFPSIVLTIADAGNSSKPYLWNMAAGYLQTLNGNCSQAKTYFDKSEKQIPSGQIYKDQIRIFKFINKINETSTMDANAENKLLSDLDWLYTQLHKSAAQELRYEKAIEWSKLYLSFLYQSQQEIVYAQIYNPKSDFYHNNANLEALKSFLEKEDKTPYEKFAASIAPVNAEGIYEYQAIRSTLDDNLQQAFAYMEKSGSNGEFELLANPFNGYIKDCHDCEHAAPQKAKFSKLRFIEVMKIMKEKINKGEEVYNNNLLIANGFYNISFFGNARLFFECNIIGTSLNTTWAIDDFYKPILFSMKNAKYYYEQALKAATTNEQKAKCCYMLAKCERNDYYVNNSMVGDDYGNSKNPDFKAWDGFRRLKSQYSATKYYKDVIAECGYFAQYAKK